MGDVEQSIYCHTTTSVEHANTYPLISTIWGVRSYLTLSFFGDSDCDGDSDRVADWMSGYQGSGKFYAKVRRQRHGFGYCCSHIGWW